jgi:hypothetical protein
VTTLIIGVLTPMQLDRTLSGVAIRLDLYTYTGLLSGAARGGNRLGMKTGRDAADDTDKGGQ